MKRFLTRLCVFSLLVFVVIELVCRVAVDPLYFYETNAYRPKANSLRERFKKQEPVHPDYLFIGSSRVAASIDAGVFSSSRPGSVAINAGRGYTTPAVHYQALKKQLELNPDFLRGTDVFIEYPGSKTFTEDFDSNQLRVYEPDLPTDKPMPHLLLPYINWRELNEFFRLSPNPAAVKVKMAFLYTFASYRCMPFVNEKVKKINTMFEKKTDANLSLDGGIRDTGLDFIRNNALKVAALDIERQKSQPLLTKASLDKSFLAKFDELVTTNGGKLYLITMPLHSAQTLVFSTDHEKENKRIFEGWLNERNIKVLTADTQFTDDDFPDTWHLAADRREEFSTSLLHQLQSKE